MDKSIIYYTDNLIGEPIKSVVVSHILASGLPIVSASLKPINLGKNIVVGGERGYPTMVKQILTALEASKGDTIFFCEHDVLYPKTHFDFTPSKKDIFYYNSNVWRWDYPNDRAITYDRLISLSGLCVDRRLALSHYKARHEFIEKNKLRNPLGSEPQWARLMGYEPGTKKKRRGGFSDDDFETWSSTVPIVDIRHRGTFSPQKTAISSFKHQPANWQEIQISEIPGWNLKELFGL